jgi:hypothetical protein
MRMASTTYEGRHFPLEIEAKFLRRRPVRKAPLKEMHSLRVNPDGKIAVGDIEDLRAWVHASAEDAMTPTHQADHEWAIENGWEVAITLCCACPDGETAAGSLRRSFRRRLIDAWRARPEVRRRSDGSVRVLVPTGMAHEHPLPDEHVREPEAMRAGDFTEYAERRAAVFEILASSRTPDDPLADPHVAGHLRSLVDSTEGRYLGVPSHRTPPAREREEYYDEYGGRERFTALLRARGPSFGP